MKTQKLLWLGCLTGLLLSACSHDLEDQPGLNSDGEMVKIKLDAPEAIQLTRSVPGTNSEKGAVTNIDWSQYDLRYQLAIYSSDGTQLLVAPQSKVYDTYNDAVFEFRLTPNNTYKFVAWADFVTQGSTEDLHYNTADFSNISIKTEGDRDKTINDESRDAYFVTQNITITQTFNESLTLKRPFAKVRVITTDWDDNNKGVEKPDNFKVTYHDCTRFSGLNAINGEATGDANADASTIYTAQIATDENGGKFYEDGYDASASNRTLLVDYLIATQEEQAIHFNLEILSGTTSIISRDFKTEIPIRRNYLTTIIGNLLSVGGSINISIDESFTNQWIEGEEWWNSQSITPQKPAYDEATRTYTINTREEFAWLPDHINEMIANWDEKNQKWTKKAAKDEVTIQLMNDIDMSGVEWKPIYPASTDFTYTFEGNGHTLRNFSMSGKFGAIYEYKILWITLGQYEAYTGVWGKFDGIMKNLTFENITINGLAYAEFPIKDVEGNPVDHSKEYAYFAGCIGYTGGNQWSMNSKFENVHAKHVQIKSSTIPAQNLGGLVGWVGSGGGAPNGPMSAAFKDCSAYDIHMTGYQAGGLVGQVLGDRGVSFDNCSTENIYIRYNRISASSGFIGNIGDGGIKVDWNAFVKINNCTPAQHVYYINDQTGESYTSYQPQSSYYGRKNTNDVVTIVTEETVEP